MPEKDFLFLQLRDLPYFRAFLRAVESSYYQDLPLPAPVYDVGCGDGHFASLTFDQKIDVGLDPWHGPIHEAKKFGAGAYSAHRRGADRNGARIEEGCSILLLCPKYKIPERAFHLTRLGTRLY